MSNKTIRLKEFTKLLIDNKVNFQINLFGKITCDDSFQVGPRIINDHLIYYLESGGFNATLNGKEIHLYPGKLFWVNPGIKQEFKPLSTTDKTTVTYFRVFIGEESFMRFEEDFLIFENKYISSDIIKETIEALKISKTWGAYSFKSLLVSTLCSHINRNSQHLVSENGLSKKHIHLALEFISNNLCRRFSVADIAQALRMNADYFSRQFKKSLGDTYQNFIKKERIQYAMHYLSESTLLITEIADKLGYDDIYFFSRQFKEVVGVSPTNWREQKK